jgi:hypothetical protein
VDVRLDDRVVFGAGGAGIVVRLEGKERTVERGLLDRDALD